MNLAYVVHDGGVFAPLQFGGDLIGLAIAFLILAIVAAIAGASGVTGLSMTIAKWLVILFVVLAVVAFILCSVGRPALRSSPPAARDNQKSERHAVSAALRRLTEAGTSDALRAVRSTLSPVHTAEPGVSIREQNLETKPENELIIWTTDSRYS